MVSPGGAILFERLRCKITVCLRDSKEMRIAANLIADSAADLLFKFDLIGAHRDDSISFLAPLPYPPCQVHATL